MSAGALVKITGTAIKSSKFLGKSSVKNTGSIITSQKVKKNPTENSFKLTKGNISQGFNFANGVYDSFKRQEESKKSSSGNDILKIVQSIEKKVIKIDSLLKNKLNFSKKSQEKKRKDSERKRFKSQEEKLENPKKFNVKENLSKSLSKTSFFDAIKRFIFFTVLGWLYDKIVPLIPSIMKVFGKVMDAAYFAMEVFGGLANGLTKFLAGGIRIVNGLTKTLAVISGAKTDKEIQDFEKKFNRMIDLTILTAMLAGDIGFDIFDFLKKGKKGKGSAQAARGAKGVFRGGVNRSIKRIGIKVGGKAGGKAAQGLTKGASSFANKATGGIFSRGGGRSLTRLAIKVGGKGSGQFVKGAGNFLGKAAGPIATVAMAAWDFTNRKTSGQSNLQAGAGTAAGVGGALAGAKGGAVVGAAIGSIVPGLGTALGGLIGGAIGAAGGAWAASSLADKATGANKAVPKEPTIPNTGYSFGGIIRKYEKGGIIRPTKQKPQETQPGKDVGGYYEISKLFPDPTGAGKSGSRGGSEKLESSNNNPVWWNPFTWGNKNKVKQEQANEGTELSLDGPPGGALKSLRDTSSTFKKIPFVGELMGIAVDIAMGQKPDKPFYKRISKGLIFLSQKLSTIKSLNLISDVGGEVQRLATGGITETVNQDFTNIRFTEKSIEEVSDTLSVMVEKGANDALTDIRKEILKSKLGVSPNQKQSTSEKMDVRDRDPSARSGYDPRYDELPSSGGGGGGGGGVYKPILDLIAKYEAGSGGWESMYPSTRLRGATKMTIAEVARKATGAVGMYQNLPEYLVARAKAVGLNPNKDLYNEENQRKIAVYLIERGQAGVTPRMLKDNPDESMIRLARVWAAIPVPKDMKGASGPIRKGQSYYSGVGSNKAHITPDMMYKAMGASVKLSEKPQKAEQYKGPDPRAKGEDKKGGSKIGGKSIVDIGKNLISQKFAVAEHPDFTKNPTSSGGSYTPGKGSVSNVHRGQGHYDGRAIDVTDWTSGYPGRYNSVADSLQKNPAVKMLIHDKWGFYKDGQKSGPGGHGHPTHLHVETKFHGGLVKNDGLVKIHAGEFVVDKDTVNLFGFDFFKSMNSIENNPTLKKIAPVLVQRIEESIKGGAYVVPPTDEYPQGEGPKDTKKELNTSKETTKKLDEFNKQEETKTEESQQKEDDNKQRVQVTPASHPQSGSGFTIKGVTDGNGRPLILSKSGIKAFGEMMQDSKGAVKGSDVASGKRSVAHNRKVGGVPNSNHLGGNALDIHGTSEPWMRRYGKTYGWIVNDYPGSHGGHFDYKGDDKDSGGDTLATMSSDSTIDSVTDYSTAPSQGGGRGGGAPSGGGGGGSAPSGSNPVDIEAEPTETLIPGKPSKSKPGSKGEEDLTLDILGSYEDLRLEAYPDAIYGWGVPTIGFGATKINGRPVKAGDKITKEQAYALKKHDMERHKDRVVQQLGKESLDKLPAHVRIPLMSIAFNYGSLPSGVSERVKSGLAKGDYTELADYIENKLGRHDRGINQWRRSDEAKIIRTGKSGRLQGFDASPNAIAKLEKDEKSKDGERPTEAGGDPGDIEKDQQIAGSTKDKRYGRLGVPNTDGQDTGADLELFGRRGEIGKSFGDNDKNGPYGNRGVEISFPYELVYLDKIPGGRNAGRKSIDVDGTQRRVYKGAEGSAGFGNVGSYFYKDPRTGKMFEVMMGHGNKPFKKFKNGEKIPAGTVVGWQGASGSSDSMQGGVYDHVSFHVNAIDGGDAGPIFDKFVNSLLGGEGAKITARRREEKKAQAEIAKKKAKEEKKDPIAKAQKAGGNLVSNIASSVSSFFGFGNKSKKSPIAKASKPSGKPKVAKAQGGGQIGSANVKENQINRFTDYERPGSAKIYYQEKIKYIEVPQKIGSKKQMSMPLGPKPESQDNSYNLRRQ